METVISIISSVGIVILFAVIFCLIGQTILRKTGIECENRCYVFASSYFIGMAVYLAVLRTLSLALPSYKAAFGIVLVLSGVFAAMEIYKRHLLWVRRNIRMTTVLAVLWLAHVIHALLYRFTDVKNVELTPHSGIGTLEAIRYVNIARFFVEQDSIPVLNQSYGQSLLASLSILLGRDNICFALMLWLSLSAAFLCLLLYSIFRKYFSGAISALLVCLVHMGSVSLTLAPIRVVDSDYPFISNGYTDSVVGAATFLIYTEIMIHILMKCEKMTIFHYLISVCVTLYWAMSAPHNIFVVCGMGCLFLICLLYKKDYRNAVRGMLLGICIIAGSLVAVFEGGMLTPSSIADQVEIEGIMAVEESRHDEGIAIVPVMNYQFSKKPGQLWGIAQSVSFVKETLDCAVEGLHNGEYYVVLYCLSMLWWDSIRIIFWPLLGVIGVVLAAYHRRDNGETFYWAIAGVGVLFTGYPIAFLVSYNAYKWELSRFMMPFYLMGMIFLTFFVGRALTYKARVYRYVGVLCVFCILTGQILDKILILYQNGCRSDILSLMKEMILF